VGDPVTRAERKTARRDLAAWFRDHALTPNGEAWRAATDDGVRDVETLRRLNAADGLTAKRLPDGSVLPAGLHPGDRLTDDDAVVLAPPVTDPETGTVWVTVTTTDPTGVTRQDDRQLPAGTPVDVTRAPRTAPAWVQAAAAEYRDARDAWEGLRESTTVLAPSTVPGCAGADVTMAQLETADYATHVPRPRFADYLRDHAARLREPDTEPARP
jgi:hypothetical protein